MIGLDTATSVIQVHGVNETGKVEIRRKLRRSELIPFFEKQEACTIVMEACGAAHPWGGVLSSLGHTVKLIAPEAVRPFVKKGKKNDPADAAALCEAAGGRATKGIRAGLTGSSMPIRHPLRHSNIALATSRAVHRRLLEHQPPADHDECHRQDRSQHELRDTR
jgi:error-prone DNA polymerase